MTFKDQYSVYKNNSALYGGAISCTTCVMEIDGNEFYYNMALSGGAIYVDNEG